MELVLVSPEFYPKQPMKYLGDWDFRLPSQVGLCLTGNKDRDKDQRRVLSWSLLAGGMLYLASDCSCRRAAPGCGEGVRGLPGWKGPKVVWIRLWWLVKNVSGESHHFKTYVMSRSWWPLCGGFPVDTGHTLWVQNNYSRAIFSCAELSFRLVRTGY